MFNWENKTISRHIIMWAVFIAYEIGFLTYTVGLRSTLLNFIIFYALNISLFYFNAHVVLDYAFFRTKSPYFTAFSLILAELAGYLVLKFAIDLLLSTGKVSVTEQLKHSSEYLADNIWRGIYFVGFSTAYWSMIYMLRFKEKNHRMETEHLLDRARSLELENAVLQNQISPHLLFNTLNFIYNSVYLKSEKAGNGILLLSDLMRYSLVSGEKNKTVPLADEVAQIRNLVALSRLRFGDGLRFNFRCKGMSGDHSILPLILVTLVENMVKHGDLEHSAVPASVRLDAGERSVSFKTINQKRCGSPYQKGGFGLSNLRKRLDNFYADKYLLELSEDENIFTVNLLINL